jgi:ATP-dependent helicase HepA
MAEFVVGQRWVVDAEPELGLGVVVAVDPRVVTLVFPQAECERMYARQKAPLTRIVFEIGDQLHTSDGRSGAVQMVHDHAGLKIYDLGLEQLVPEISLSSEIKTNQPLLRLQTGQLDASKWFAFRRLLDRGVARTWQSQLGGLLGVRANLIAHQLYVANTACQQDSVRVLLADEVGLGKTLEAGMILARLLKFERAHKVLILVPDALQIQWLVELIRRFSLRPELYAGKDHDFSLGQIHLIPHGAMCQDVNLSAHIAEFDCAIVDEAHHIHPNTENFHFLQQLSVQVRHLILLSATPEQLGLEGHFARLKLLDSAKFDQLENFIALEETYSQLNQKIRELPNGRAKLLKQYQLDTELSDAQVIDHLLDCHGVGRVMFRNTRASVKGFPERKAVLHALNADTTAAKYDWLAELLNTYWTDKILVICHSIEQVLECESYLWQKHGIHTPLFHEKMDLVERDSAAAYFADLDDGSQLLLCSEIGSEGRNFQFSHHLVCLDLPDHPDVLEQRIGRLDRIGQTETVHVHIPYFEGGTEWRKLVWFHQILTCIDRQSPAAGAVHDLHWQRWVDSDFAESVSYLAKQKSAELEKQIQEGRDALLEMNSCRQPQAQSLVDKIAQFEQETPLALVEMASELFNFHFEDTQGGAYSLIPSDNMLIPSLPGIPLDGVEVTFDRALANAREDVMFITWDSPFITGLWDLLHHSDLGSASVALLPSKQLPPGKCLIEACFDLIVQSPLATSCLPFLADLSVRVLVLEAGSKDLADALPELSLEKSLTQVDKKIARKIVLSRKDVMPQWYAQAEDYANRRAEHVISKAIENIKQYFAAEVSRLEYLAKHNSSVSPEEVGALKIREASLINALNHHIKVQLSAIRLVVTSAV